MSLVFAATHVYLQCDEGKPQCKRCVAYSVFCNYNSKSQHHELQLSAAGTSIEILTNFTLTHPLNQSISYGVAPDLRSQGFEGQESLSLYQCDRIDSELLRKFQSRTVFAISIESNIHIHQNHIARLACSVSAFKTVINEPNLTLRPAPVPDAFTTSLDSNA